MESSRGRAECETFSGKMLKSGDFSDSAVLATSKSLKSGDFSDAP